MGDVIELRRVAAGPSEAAPSQRIVVDVDAATRKVRVMFNHAAGVVELLVTPETAVELGRALARAALEALKGAL
jgi:hypothetical protein